MDLTKLKGSLKRYVKATFPPELVKYVPGQKLVAGAVLYLAAQVAGLDSNQVVNLPVIGEFTVEDAAAFIGFFFWPTNKPVNFKRKKQA